MLTHFHPKCFKPPKQIKSGVTDRDLLDWLEEGRNFDSLDAEQLAYVIAGIHEGIATNPKTLAAAKKRKFEEMAAKLEAEEAEDSSDDDSSDEEMDDNDDDGVIDLSGSKKEKKKKKKKKKAKKKKKKKAKKNPSPEIIEMQLFLKYNKMKNAQMKEMLKWNRQPVGGTKDVLVEKCKDGEVNGAIPPCPKCEGGGKSGTTLKVNDKDPSLWKCSGYYNQDGGFMAQCFFAAPINELKRDTWVTSATESRELIADDEAALAKKAAALIPSAPFPIAGGLGNTEILQLLYKQAEIEGIDLPNNSTTKQKIGAFYMTHESRQGDGSADGRAILIELAGEYGTIEKKKEQKKARASSCRNPLNAGMLCCFVELARLSKAGGLSGFRIAPIFNAINFISGLEEEITEPLKYSKGKTKVKGIGAGTSGKMIEFMKTGTMEKIEKLKESLGENNDVVKSEASSSSSSTGGSEYGGEY